MTSRPASVSAVDDRVTPVLLWGRSTMLALVVFGLGTVGHVSAGGLLPHWLVLADLFAFAVLVCAWWLSQPATTARLVVLAAGGQAVLHLGLSVLAGHEPGAGPHHHASPWADLLAHATADAPMMAAHLAAAAGVGWWLATGERALWAFLSLWRHRTWWAPALVPVPVAGPRPRPTDTSSPRRCHPALLVRAVSRRGPPVLLAGG